MKEFILPAVTFGMVGSALLYDYTGQWADRRIMRGKRGRWMFLIWVAWVLIWSILVGTMAYYPPAPKEPTVRNAATVVLSYVHAGPGHPIHPRAERLHG